MSKFSMVCFIFDKIVFWKFNEKFDFESIKLVYVLFICNINYVIYLKYSYNIEV